jgi:hypothetical protein
MSLAKEWKVPGQQSTPDWVRCSYCSNDIDYNTSQAMVAVESSRLTVDKEYFCNDSCRSRHIYDETSMTGKRQLRKLVAGLELICDTEIRHRVPEVARYEMDTVEWQKYPVHQSVSLDDFLNMARTFLLEFSPEDGASWAIEAQLIAARALSGDTQ